MVIEESVMMAVFPHYGAAFVHLLITNTPMDLGLHELFDVGLFLDR